MDSDDEVQGDGGEEEAQKSQKDDESDAEEKEEAAGQVNTETLGAVESFGQMMRLAPAVRRWLQECAGAVPGPEGPAGVAAVCRALARTKFFDGDILEELYSVLRKLLQEDRLDVSQADDAVRCLGTLNAYDKGVLGAVAGAFRTKTRAIEGNMRNAWLEIFRFFGHGGADGDFLQLLEVPPLPPGHIHFQKVRCGHHSRGACVLGNSCTFSHDPQAPLQPTDGCGNEDWWRSKPLVMTQNQKTLGHGVYGISSNSDLRAPPMAPAGWNRLMAPTSFGSSGRV